MSSRIVGKVVINEDGQKAISFEDRVWQSLQVGSEIYAHGSPTECKECFGTGKHGGYEQSLSECQGCEGSGEQLCEDHRNPIRSCEQCEDDRKQEISDRYSEYYAGVL